MRVDQIWQYPVKSMLGGRVDAAELASNGVVGDRMFALFDLERDAIASGRKVPGIVKLAAAYTSDGGVLVTVPGGSTIASTSTDVDEHLSAAVGHPVSLSAKPEASATDHWRHGKPDSDDMMANLRTIFGRLPDEPLPDFSVFPPEMLEFEYPPGNYFDCYPLMIMTTSALRSLREALPDSAVDERRFRPSLVIDTGDEPGHPEFGWTGRDVRIGDAVVHIRDGCPRCVMVTREFADDMPADRGVLRHVVKDLGQNVGVYATVVRAGAVRAGDSVEFV